jgi:hypothetical protein
MLTDETPLHERVEGYFSQLSAAAKELNSISDELGKSISEIDFALKKLNLGVSVWVPIREDDGDINQETWYWREDIGYAKVGANWGICLRKVSGDYNDPDQERVESSLFNDAPRTLRISAIGKIPELLEKLSVEAVETTKKIRAKLDEAQSVAKAVTGAASLPRVRARNPFSLREDSVLGSGGQNVDSWRSAVIAALANSRYSSAAELLNTAAWSIDGSGLLIEVPGAGKKLVSLTINPAVEKIIRQELQRLGGPEKFAAVSGAGRGPEGTDGISASGNEPEVEK